jgi:hypothetical protein
MRKTSFVLAGALALLAGPAFAQSTYDESWHRAPFWSGEYPSGFSVLKDVTVQLRPLLDPKAEKTIACDLPAKATYQVWNNARVEEQGLHFVSFTKIAEYRIKDAYTTTLYNSAHGVQAELSFKPGDIWRDLVYYAEGAFLMEYDGVQYDGDQSLYDVSEPVDPDAEGGYEEWLRINCPSNQWGWLYMGDITVDDVTFRSPNISGYGDAKDLD